MSLPRLRRAIPSDLLAIQELQSTAYAENRNILGVEPLPLLADYAEILTTHEVWLAAEAGRLGGALILEPRSDDLLIWSLATAPQAQGQGIGNRLLAAAEQRAIELGRHTVRLYTGEKLTANVAWYRRHGYAVERIEQLADRRIVHMIKKLARA